MAQGPGQVNLGLNASQYISQIGVVVQSTSTYNQTLNQLNGTLNQFNSSGSSAAGIFGQLNGQLHLLTQIATARALFSIYEGFQHAVEGAAEFSRSIGLIQTITADANLSFQDWADGIKKVSDALGTPLVETATAAYDLLSNQVTRGADTFGVLAQAANLANITGSKTTDAVNVLSSVINAYGYSSRDAETLAAKLFTTVDLGRVKLSEVSNTIGRVAETGKALGVTFEEINASMIAITQTGIKTDTAMTLISNVFVKLLKPTKDLQAVYDRLGVTPDTFVRINGLAGALEILRKETGGSAAGLSKLFNEIRGFQGITTLLDNTKAFTQGLKDQEGALERARKAKEVFEATPGFKFQQESNELTNTLTTGIKTQLLETVLKVSEAFGGLKVVVLDLAAASAVVGGAFAGWTISLAASRVAAIGLNNIVGAIAFPVAIGVLALEIGNLVIRYQELQEAENRFYQTALKLGQEKARQSQEHDDKSVAKQVEDFKKGLDTKKAAILAFTSEERQRLGTIGDGLEKVGDKLHATLKNSVELVIKAAGAGLKEIETRLKHSLEKIREAKKAAADAEGAKGDALFNYKRAKDQSLTGGQGEKKILEERLAELQKEMDDAKRRGDKEAYDKAANKAEAILNEAATATDENGNLKYYGQEQAITEFYDQRVADMQEIENIHRRIAAILNAQKASVSAQVKDVEDAAKAVLDVSATDKHGKPAYKNQAEFDTDATARQADFEKKLAILNKNPANNDQFRGAEVISTRKLLADTVATERKAFNKSSGNQSQQVKNFGEVGKIGDVDNAAQKLADAVVKKIQEKSNDSSRLGDGAYAAINKSRASLGSIQNEALLDRNKNFIPEEIHNRRGQPYQNDAVTDLIDKVNKLADKGNFKGATAALDALEAKLRSFASFDKKVLPDAEGNANARTPKEAVTTARNDLADRQRAVEAGRAANQVFVETGEGAQKALDDVVRSAKGLGGSLSQTGTDLTSFITKADNDIKALDATLKGLQNIAAQQTEKEVQANNGNAPEANKSMGGVAGYYAEGGETRGVDTQSVMMDPNEFVVNSEASGRFKAQLQAMNAGWDPGTRGGSNTNVGDINVSVNGGPTSQQSIQEIANGINRGIRQGTIRLGR